MYYNIAKWFAKNLNQIKPLQKETLLEALSFKF